MHKAEEKIALSPRYLTALILARRYSDEQGIWRPHRDMRNVAAKLSKWGFLNTLGSNDLGGRYCYIITKSGRAAIDTPRDADGKPSAMTTAKGAEK